MKRFLRWAAAAVVALTLCWALAAWFDWLPRISAEQRAALALMGTGTPTRPPAIDALPRMWLLTREVPREAWPALLALPVPELAARMQAYPERRVPAVIDRDNLPSLHAAHANAAALRAAVAAAQPLLQRRDWLVQADGIRWPGMPSAQQALLLEPPDFYGIARAFRQSAALAFVDGDAARGQALLCESAGFWRRLSEDADVLTTRMGLARMAEMDVRLLSQMRATAGSGTPRCDALRPPSAAELDLCPVMRAEFRLRRDMMRELIPEQGWLDRVQARLLWNPVHGEALEAQAFARYCAAEGTFEPRDFVPGCATLGWPFDFLGCALVPIATPVYLEYPRRVDYHGQVLRLAALAEWLRAGGTQDAAALRARFAARPQALREAGQSLRVGADGAWLEFTPRHRRAQSRGAPVPVLLPAPARG